MQFLFCWGTYCRNGISTTQERSRGLLLISLLKQAFCWKPSLMFKIYWLCQVTNRTSFRPRQLASSINLTTGCLKRIKHRHDKLRVQKLVFLPGTSKSPSTTFFPSLPSLSLALKHADHQNLLSFVVISPTKTDFTNFLWFVLMLSRFHMSNVRPDIWPKTPLPQMALFTFHLSLLTVKNKSLLQNNLLYSNTFSLFLFVHNNNSK